MVADPERIPDEVIYSSRGKQDAYNPFTERQPHFYSTAVPRRTVSKGEELFDNYLGMTGLILQGWAEDVKGLKDQCSGRDVGQITKYLMERNKTDEGNKKIGTTTAKDTVPPAAVDSL